MPPGPPNEEYSKYKVWVSILLMRKQPETRIWYSEISHLLDV